MVLRDRSRLFDLAVRHSNLGYGTMNLKTNRVEWSKNGYAMAGLSPNTKHLTLSDMIAGIIHSDQARIAELFEKSRREKTGFKTDTAIIRPDGKIRYCRITTEYVEEDGEPFLLGVAEDYTETHLRDRELLETEDQYQDIYENAAIGIYRSTIDGRPIQSNPAFARMMGYDSVDEWLARSADLEREWYVNPDRRAEFAREIEQTGRITNFESEIYRHATGERIWVSETARLVRSDDGTGFYEGTIENITRRKQAEQKLAQAVKMEAVGQLTGGLAHDFNNLLAVIIGNMQLMERRIGDDDRQQRRLRAVIDAADRGAQLTKRLLAFSRRQSLDPTEVDPNTLIAGIEELLVRSLGERIELKSIKADGLDNVKVDANELESSILNLAINARDAMPAGGKLTIETANVVIDENYARVNEGVSPGNYVMIAVSDNGMGMPEDVVEKVFEPFFSTKEEGKGTGLGLSMVFGFVKQSGGYIKIYSEVGNGTSVKIYLPRFSSGVLATKTSNGEGQLIGGSETILVVEDKPDVRAIAVEMLEDLGYVVIEAENGEIALSCLRQRADIDLVFSDIVMPGGVDGFDVAAEVRRHHPHVALLHTSGYAAGAAARHSGQQIENIISKPYRKDDLARRIRQTLDSHAELQKLTA
ncbi:MAG: ATP-binding protein [Pseudomonadota bacterium]